MAALCLASCSHRAAQLPVYASVPSFAGIDSSSKPFTQSNLAGRVWVVDFIYTNCPAACPMMSAHMHRLATELQGDGDVGFLSISVDPARDTPQAMQAFAQRYHGGNEQWKFVTTSPETVHLLAYETFHVGDVLGKIEHSTKFVVVDKQMRIRGYYSSSSPEDLASLKQDVESLRNAT